MEKKNLKHVAFASRIPRLVIGIQQSVESVATQCFVHGLIPTDVHELVISSSRTDRKLSTRKLLNAVTDCITEDHEAFDKFVAILDGQPLDNCKSMSVLLVETHQSFLIQASPCTEESTNDYTKKLVESLPRKPEGNYICSFL